MPGNYPPPPPTGRNAGTQVHNENKMDSPIVDFLVSRCISHRGNLLRHVMRNTAPLLVLAGCLCLPAVLRAQTSTSQSTMRHAQSLAASNHLQQANELLSALVQRDPRNAQAWQLLGEIQTRQQLYDDAMKSFQATLAIDPASKAAQSGEVKAAVKNALSLRAAGDQNGALASLLRARKVVPNSPELLTDFGILADEMQIYHDADKALTQAHKLDPSNLKTLYALAHVELDEQNVDAAEKHLRAYLKQRPNDATAHYGLGHLLHMTSHDDAAIIQLRRSIALQPRQIASYYELGVIALARGQNAEAKTEFSRVLKMNPYHGGALTGMGILAFRAKDYSTADKYLSNAVLYAPDYVTAHRYYALVLMRLGRKTEAADQLKEARALSVHQQKLSHGYTILKTP